MKNINFVPLIILPLLLAGCAPSNVQISHGTFENRRYMSNIANFSCDLGTGLEGDSPTTLYDFQDENGLGSMQLINDFGVAQKVEYVPIAKLLPDIKALFEDPATYATGLEIIQEYLTQALTGKSPNTQVMNSYYLTNERMMVVIFDVPQGSFLFNQTDNVNLDSVQAYYLFADDEYVYYVSNLASITPGFGRPTEQGILQGLDDFYQKCTFDS